MTWLERLDAAATASSTISVSKPLFSELLGSTELIARSDKPHPVDEISLWRDDGILFSLFNGGGPSWWLDVRFLGTFLKGYACDPRLKDSGKSTPFGKHSAPH